MSQCASAVYCNELVERGERVEAVVDIYESADVIRSQEPTAEKEDSNLKRKEETQHKGECSARSRFYKLTALCLVLLCLLLLAAVTVLWIKFPEDRDLLQTRYNNLATEQDQLQTSYNNLATERKQLQTRYNNLATERNQLQTSYNNLATERDQLQTSYNNLATERDQLQTRYSNLATERDQLQTRYNNLSTERDQLQTRYNNLTLERDQLQRIQDNILQMGWGFFNTSIYYISTEMKTWAKGREECQKRGADLVIINSKEEQEFINTRFNNTEAWIGLSDAATEGDFKWVDGKGVSIKFWWTGEPNDYGRNEDCAITGYKNATNISSWADFTCNHIGRAVAMCERVVN